MAVKKIGKASRIGSSISFTLEGSSSTLKNALEFTPANGLERLKKYHATTSSVEQGFRRGFFSISADAVGLWHDREECFRRAFDDIQNESQIKPLGLSDKKERPGHYLFRGSIYKADRLGYSEEEIVLQIHDVEEREQRQFERLRGKTAPASDEEQRKRERISEEVRIAVWRRDGGKCVRCGSKEFLEYDHIVPFSKGGSNTARNIELLCEACNRAKKDNIA